MSRACTMLIAFVLTTPLLGCRGQARLSLVPINTVKITSGSPLSYDFKAQQCYWWTDQGNGKLNITMSYNNLSLGGDLTRRALDVSIVLEAMPDGQEQHCRTKGQDVRAVWHRGSFHLRLQPRSGALSLKRVNENTIQGQFRLVCRAEKFEILRGWIRQVNVLLQGKFTAVRNPTEGPVIRERIGRRFPNDADDHAANTE